MNDIWIRGWFKKKCDFCGERKMDVGKVVDPYLQDLFDEEKIVKICDKCYNDRVASI